VALALFVGFEVCFASCCGILTSLDHFLETFINFKFLPLASPFTGFWILSKTAKLSFKLDIFTVGF